MTECCQADLMAGCVICCSSEMLLLFYNPIVCVCVCGEDSNNTVSIVILFLANQNTNNSAGDSQKM